MATNQLQKTNDQCLRTHRSGFVNIVGNPNVGKSTLMNALVGERLSIITSKAQTTRHRILGIVNGEDFQMVYSDTPGVLAPNYRLQEKMLEFSRSALVDADVLLYVTEPQDTIDRNPDFVEKVKKMSAAGTRVFLIINKIDLTTQETLDSLVAFWQAQLPEAEIFAISAQERFGVDQLFEAIKNALPVGQPFFPKDQLTDKSERFFVNEIIREKILQNYDKEIPYSVEVEVESFCNYVAYQRHHLLRTRKPERHHHRQRWFCPQAGRDAGSAGNRGLLPEKSLPPALRQGGSRLAF